MAVVKHNSTLNNSATSFKSSLSLLSLQNSAFTSPSFFSPNLPKRRACRSVILLRPGLMVFVRECGVWRGLYIPGEIVDGGGYK